MLNTSKPIIRDLRQISVDTWSLAMDAGNGNVMALALSTANLLRYYGEGGVRWHFMRKGLWLEDMRDTEWSQVVADYIKTTQQPPRHHGHLEEVRTEDRQLQQSQSLESRLTPQLQNAQPALVYKKDGS
jgi:hypothetical protein